MPPAGPPGDVGLLDEAERTTFPSHALPPRHRRKRSRAIGPVMWLVLVALVAVLVAIVLFEVATGALTIVPLVLVVLGINTLIWTVVGLCRYLAARLPAGTTRSELTAVEHSRHRFGPEHVAAIIPAHNEAAVLEDSLRAVAALLPVSNIHVISDGSTDDTAAIAREFGVRVLELSPNRGKAGALLAGIQHFALEENFGIVLLLDADTRLSPDYLQTGLPEFDSPDVVAVAGRVRSVLDPAPRTRIGRFIVAYRARVYEVLQLLVKYGQAARRANAIYIVPGFASMYRTDVLSRIDVAAPGLVIEDFNMTFEVHSQKLGRIAFHPGVAVAYTQDPDTLHDYVRQIRRWSLGFWQTVRLHGLHADRFSAALAMQIAELLSSSFLLLLMLPVMYFTVYTDTLADTFGHPQIMGVELVGPLRPQYVLIGFILPDLLMTTVAAVSLRRPRLLLASPLFPLMRLVDASVWLWTLPMAWRTRSSGSWVSPTRRGGERQPHELPAAHEAVLTNGAPDSSSTDVFASNDIRGFPV